MDVKPSEQKITSSILLILSFWNVANLDILNTSPLGDLIFKSVEKKNFFSSEREIFYEIIQLNSISINLFPKFAGYYSRIWLKWLI